MINFKLTSDGKAVYRTNENGTMESYSIDAEEYKDWLAEGNTPEPAFTDAEILEQEKQERIEEAKNYLVSTDWIVTKMAETAAVGGDVASLLTKYADELSVRVAKRELINQLGR